MTRRLSREQSTINFFQIKSVLVGDTSDDL